MLLQPRKFKYKTRQKNRTVKSFGLQTLHYGDCGLLTFQPLQLSSKQIFRLKMFLKRSIRKSEYTRRFVWFSVFPHLPLTKKPKGMRMGKGAGKLSSWKIQLSGGKLVFEFKNLRLGRAKYFCNQMAHKLPTKTRIVTSNLWNRNMRFVTNTNFSLRSYW